jgi:hypothetical protein
MGRECQEIGLRQIVSINAGSGDFGSEDHNSSILSCITRCDSVIVFRRFTH